MGVSFGSVGSEVKVKPGCSQKVKDILYETEWGGCEWSFDEENFDKDGNGEIIGISYDGEKYGEGLLDELNLVADCFEKGSYVHFFLPDYGEHARWYHNGEKWFEQNGMVIFTDLPKEEVYKRLGG